jgi:hypothetical protein
VSALTLISACTFNQPQRRPPSPSNLCRCVDGIFFRVQRASKLQAVTIATITVIYTASASAPHALPRLRLHNPYPVLISPCRPCCRSSPSAPATRCRRCLRQPASFSIRARRGLSNIAPSPLHSALLACGYPWSSNHTIPRRRVARQELRRLRGRLGPGAAAVRRHAAMPALHRLPTIHRAEGANRPPPPDPTLARSRARAIYPTSRGASMTPASISSDLSGT